MPERSRFADHEHLPTARMRICSLVFMLSVLAPASYAAPTPAPVRVEINVLLARMQSSGCTFYRNGQWFNAARAKRHLMSKLENVEAVTTLESTEEFIALVATKSSASGRPYQLRCAGAAATPSAEWLTTELAAIRSEAEQ
jgi:hypothetical protein